MFPTVSLFSCALFYRHCFFSTLYLVLLVFFFFKFLRQNPPPILKLLVTDYNSIVVRGQVPRTPCNVLNVYWGFIQQHFRFQFLS